MIKQGFYKTFGGLTAKVVRIKPNGINNWFLSGYIINPDSENLLHLCHWSVSGQCVTGQEHLDLVV